MENKDSRVRFLPQRLRIECPSCGKQNVQVRVERQDFPYGVGPNRVTLTAEAPVYTCPDCSFKFTDDASEDARHEAVCRHLKVMTPAEIRAIRRRYGLSRAEFARVTGIGVASLSRWENGQLIQSPALDQLLYLLTFRENLGRLQSRNPEQPISLGSTASESGLASVREPQFRALKKISLEMRQAERVFELRPTGT